MDIFAVLNVSTVSALTESSSTGSINSVGGNCSVDIGNVLLCIVVLLLCNKEVELACGGISVMSSGMFFESCFASVYSS